MPPWAKTLPWDLITDQAKREQINLDPFLLAAIVWEESKNQNCKPRWEANYKWLNDPAKWANLLAISVETEIVLQKLSWGPMQVMGATARDMGFRADIPELCRPELGIHFGGRYLRFLWDRHRDVAKVVASYNAGPEPEIVNGRFENQPYVDRVLGYFQELTSKK